MPSSRTSVMAWPADPRPPNPLIDPRSAEPGTCAAPETSNGEPRATVIALLAVTSSRPRSTSVRSLSGLGITFNVTSVITASDAPGSRQQLAQVIAGDVFHHPATGLETVAETGHRVGAEQMIAGAAGLDAARTGRDRH